jgi:glucose/arabinose dehydrogenase
LAAALIASVLVLIACSNGSATGTATVQRPVDTVAKVARAHTYVHARGVAAMTLDERGRLLYAEKDSGRIIRVSRGRRTVLARLRVVPGSESGLLGVAAGPGERIWAYYTGSRSGCPNPTRGSSGGSLVAHCVWRLRPANGKLVADRLVFSANHPSDADNHVGGGLAFGPDGALYLGIGDLGENDDPDRGPSRAQDLALPFGKILRLDPQATNRGAAGNPATCGNATNTAKRTIEDPRIWACGLRNPFSFSGALRGRMWVADVGDGCDELDIVRAGVNYGWRPPRTDCAGSGAGRPVLKLSGTPSGVAVPKSRHAGSWRGDVLFGIFADSSLHRYAIDRRRQSVISAGRGRAGWALLAGERYLFMSDGRRISRLRLPGA